MRVFVTGATGFVGSRLVRELLRRGDSVVALTRDRKRMRAADLLPADGRFQVVEGDPATPGPWQEQLLDCDAVCALAGEPIVGRRWTADFKERAEKSRVEGCRLIAQGIGRLPEGRRPGLVVAASAIGYYGPHGDESLDEETGPGSDFLAQLCVRWENAAGEAAIHGARVINARIGVVLGEGGGALAKMVPAFKAFVGGPIGSGSQYMSWIHLLDAVGLLLFCLDSEHPALRGPVNVTAPEPVTMREFARNLGQALHRPAALPVPSLAVRLLFGESADVLLTGQRVLPRRAREFGYAFRYPTLPEALKAVFSSGAA